MMKYFFWIAFAVFLAASIPHVAYFFASFEPSQGPEGVWWWAVSYAIAISIDVTVYLLSWTAFQRYRKYRTPKAVWQHWLLILMCTLFSWAVNWAYAKQFHSASMLSSAESTAPWLVNIFPFMASSFPLLGIVYTMMAETISESTSEEKQIRVQELAALTELTKQARLPMSTLRRALSGKSSINPSSLLAAVNANTDSSDEQDAIASTDDRATDKEEQKIITGQVLAITRDTPENTLEVANLSHEGNSDKLQMTVEILKIRPDMTDEALASYLSLKRPASARFWRLKATEMLNASQERTDTDDVLSAPVAFANSNGKRQ